MWEECKLAIWKANQGGGKMAAMEKVGIKACKLTWNGKLDEGPPVHQALPGPARPGRLALLQAAQGNHGP